MLKFKLKLWLSTPYVLIPVSPLQPFQVNSTTKQSFSLHLKNHCVSIILWYVIHLQTANKLYKRQFWGNCSWRHLGFRNNVVILGQKTFQNLVFSEITYIQTLKFDHPLPLPFRIKEKRNSYRIAMLSLYLSVCPFFCQNPESRESIKVSSWNENHRLQSFKIRKNQTSKLT